LHAPGSDTESVSDSHDELLASFSAREFSSSSRSLYLIILELYVHSISTFALFS
jgi:hypothetical protein